VALAAYAPKFADSTAAPEVFSTQVIDLQGARDGKWL
jgi:hypothetical protein